VPSQANREAMLLQEYSSQAVEIPYAQQWLMPACCGTRHYRIFAAVPSESPPPAGYPVIYVLDANSVFGTMTENVRLLSRKPEKTGVMPAVIVGIDYQTAVSFDSMRYYDFTPVSSNYCSSTSGGSPLPEQGGAEAFLAFIEKELKPFIKQKFPIDSSRQTLFGHSLGGLFVLHVLFTRPHAFRNYVAGSPSIHWNKDHLQLEEQCFTSRLEAEELPVEVLIAFGEGERNHISGNCSGGRELAGRLAARGVSVQFKEFEDEDHLSVLPVLVSRTLRLVLRPDL
jgi:uncharacterized protein